MSKLETLKNRRDFTLVKNHGKSVVFKTFIIQSLKNSHDHNRWGFIITKKTGNAVRRNYMRRRLRELIHRLPQSLVENPMDYVIVARSSLSKSAFVDLQKNLEQALGRLQIQGQNHAFPV